MSNNQKPEPAPEGWPKELPWPHDEAKHLIRCYGHATTDADVAAWKKRWEDAQAAWEIRRVREAEERKAAEAAEKLANG